jgi:hypothetical protein
VRAAMRTSLALFLAVVLAAGCSGGGDDADSRLSQEEYVERADTICRQFEGRLEELGNPRSLADLARISDEALPVAREGVSELKALRPPETLGARVARWLELNETNVRSVEQLRDAARAGDEDRVQEIALEAEANEARADRLAKEIGLTACAAP